jgi:hypothetical protein
MAGSAKLAVLMIGLVAAVAAAQTEATKRDTTRMSSELSNRTGVPTVAAVIPRGKVFDISVQFNGAVFNYKGVMGVLVGVVGETTRTAPYATEWCYITTRERGRERILTRDLREVQSMVLNGQVERAWDLFVAKTAQAR